MKKEIIFFLVFCCLFFNINFINAEARNLTVNIVTPGSYADIWLGVSTGGYNLIAEKGETYAFRVYVKNGMANKSLHNIGISPKTEFPFQVNSITPKTIDQLKPMEIRVYEVNITIPENTTEKKYNAAFDVFADEFPIGVFSLGGEKEQIDVVKKINTLLYIFLGILTIIILGLLFYRKYKQKDL
jgi:uncharacterized membrane protein